MNGLPPEEKLPEEELPGEDDPEEGVALPIEWYIPDTIVNRYATNMIVQRTEHEVIISFFEIVPPLIIGDRTEERKAQIEALQSVRATCVARITVASGRMPGFIEALQKNLSHPMLSSEETEESEESEE